MNFLSCFLLNILYLSGILIIMYIRVKMKNTQKGFMSQFLFAIAIAITVGGGIYWWQTSKSNPDGKLLTFSQLMAPIVNSTLRYSNPEMAFQTTVGQKLIPSPSSVDADGDSFVPFIFKSNPKSNVTEGTATITRNNRTSCLENPFQKKTNKNGLEVGYSASSGSNEQEWEKSYTRSLIKGRDMYCIQAHLKGRGRVATNNPQEDEKSVLIDKEDSALFETYINQMTDDFKLIMY